MPETEQHIPDEVAQAEHSTEEQEYRPASFFEHIAEERKEALLRHGSKGAELLDRIARGDISTTELVDASKHLPDYKKAGKAGFEFFREQGVIEELPSGSVVLDKEKLRSIDTGKISGGTKRLMQELGTTSKVMLTYATLRDRRGVSREEYGRGEFEEKPVIYIPNDEESAFDPEKIKRQKFVASLWETVGRIRSFQDQEHPTKDGGRINFDAVRWATVLYHPDYGDAYRDEEDVLQVKNPKTGKHEPVTRDLLYYRYKIFGGHQGKLPDHLRKNLPELIDNNLLTPADFRSLTGKIGSESPEFKPTHGRGDVMFNRVKHSLGAEFKRKQVIQLGPDLAAVIDTDESGRQNMTHTFRVFDKEERFLRGESDRNYRTGKEFKDELNIQEFSSERFFPRRSSESDEEYRQRIESLPDFADFWQLNQELFEQTGMGVNSFTAAEKMRLINLLYQNKAEKERIYAFINQFGREGTRALVSAEESGGRTEAVLALAEKLDPSVADQIFLKYNDILNAVENISALPTDKMADIGRIKHSILGKADNLLSEFSKTAEGEEKKHRLLLSRLILRRLEKMKTEAIIFAGTFQVIAEQGEVDFESMEQTELEAKDSSELSVAEKQEVTRIFLDNRTDYPPKLLDKTKELFERALNKGGSEFYLLYHQGELVSFIRFDKLPNGHLYAGSLNVRPEAKGSAIGTAMLKATLDKKAELTTIEAEAFAGKPRLVEYYQNYWGFQITGEIDDWKGTGEKFYQMELSEKVKRTPSAVAA